MHRYRVFKFVDNSGVAENHDQQRQHESADEDIRRDCLLGDVAVIDAPRNTASLDDISGQKPQRCQNRRMDNPDQSDSTVRETLPHVELQNDTFRY